MASLESLVNAHQRAMQRLAERAEREIAKLWLRYGTLDAASVEFAQFMGAARQVILVHRIAAAQRAEVFYATVRDLAGEVEPYEFVNRAYLSPSEMDFMTKRMIEHGTAAAQARVAMGANPADAIRASVNGVRGQSGQYVQYASRGSIMQTAGRDPRTVQGRYFRVAHVGCCSICAIAASRGAVYRTDKRRYHTFCRCDVCPAFQGMRGPVGIGAQAAKTFKDMEGSSFAEFEELWEAGGRGA